MATANPFDLLGDDDNEDPSLLLAKAAAVVKKPVATAPAAAAAPTNTVPAAKFPSKPVPPSQSVRESRNENSFRRGGRGGSGGRAGGRGGGRNGGQFRDFNNGTAAYNNGFSGAPGSNTTEDGDVRNSSERGGHGGYGGPRPAYRGVRRGGFGNAEGGDSERPRRVYERRSGTGRGSEFKRDGAGRGNWGKPTDEGFVQESEESTPVTEENVVILEKPIEDSPVEAEMEKPTGETEEKDDKEKEKEKEPEEKEMTLEEYEKIREEKRKALMANKPEERKVAVDKDLLSMQQLSLKKSNEDVIFIKLGSDKDLARRKESAEKDEKLKKSVSINEFLKPAEGEGYYGGGGRGGRGRGRGRGDRGGYRGGYGGSGSAAPSIEDPGQFPTLGGK